MSLLSPALEAFIAIVRHKTVHAAASALHITQTGVTQRLRTLEKRLNTTLFVRTRRGMMLTAEGEALLRYCESARALEGEALAKINGAGVDRSLRVSLTGPGSIMSARIIPQCLKVMNKYPNLLLGFDINDSEERVKALRSGDAQLAILQPENIAAEMESKPLRAERYVLVCTAAWKKRKLRDIITSERIIDFDATDQMTFNYLKHFGLLEQARLDRHYVNRAEAMATLLSGGCGYGVLTAEFSQPYVKSHELMVLNAGKIYENPVTLAWYPRPELPGYFADLIAVIF